MSAYTDQFSTRYDGYVIETAGRLIDGAGSQNVADLADCLNSLAPEHKNDILLELAKVAAAGLELHREFAQVVA